MVITTAAYEAVWAAPETRALNRGAQVALSGLSHSEAGDHSRMVQAGWEPLHDRPDSTLTHQVWAFEGSDFSAEIKEVKFPRYGDRYADTFAWTVLLHEPRPSGNLFICTGNDVNLVSAVTRVSGTLARNW